MNRKIQGWMSVALTVASLCYTSMSGVHVTAAASKQTLLNQLDSGLNVIQTWYDDYDGDGKKELFALTGSEEGAPHAIYFAGESWTGAVFDEDWAAYYEGAKPVCKVSGTQKLFVMEFGSYGSGSLSKCFYVKNGKPHAVKQSLEGLSHIKGKDFAIYPSAYDAMEDAYHLFTGHTWKKYYLKWIGTSFKEYKGKYISKGRLKKYENGANVLKKIKKAGYTTDKIILRSNQIININVHKKEGDSTSYENVTLKLSDGKVTVQKNGYGSEGDLVSRSSYGGIYGKSIL